MDKETLRDIIYIVIAIVFAIIAVKLFIWLLPIILIALLAYFVYKHLKKDKNDSSEEQKNKTKKKKIIIIDEEK